ncbi:MAG: M16 family metallopeptidase [Candidatus Eisenbacteria bacterium]
MRERVRESSLDNGLTILTVENPVSPTASLQVWYKVGSRNERPGITGASHIFEHMMFKGTAKYPAGAFDRVVQENGMGYNAFTSHDYTAYFETFARDRLEVAMDLESDRMQGLLLDPEEFASELSVIREERRETCEDPPYGILSEELEAAMFLVHPYHWPIIGWMSDLERITREEIAAYYRVYYRPNNAVLVVAGDVKHDDVVRMAERSFGRIEPGPPVPEVVAKEPPQRGERTVRVHKDVQLPGVIVAWRIPEAVHPDLPALQVAETVLFRGRSSRLYQRLIYEEPLATDLGGGLHVRKDPSAFFVRATARPGVEIEAVREAILETIDTLRTHPPTERELEKARNQITGDFVFGQEHNFDLGRALGAEECTSSWEDFFLFYDRSMAATAEEVAAAAAAWLHDRGRVTGYLIPEKEST